jgi:hypothetical protein
VGVKLGLSPFREEQRLMELENKGLRRTFRPKKEELTRRRRKLTQKAAA